jgi:peptidoglycan DL-endopeptidase CwlO
MYPRKPHALALVAVVACLGGAAAARAEPPAIADKEAQAQQVLAQVNDLNRQLGVTIEAYDKATWQLGQTKHSLKANAARLAQARQDLARAQRILAGRAVSIYEAGEPNATLELLLGARSLGELLDEYDAVRRISAADVKIVVTVRQTRERVARERAALQRTRARQARLVADAQRARDSIQSRLAERSRLLSSIHGEIVKLKAQEAARQAELKRQALARLAAQRRAQEQALREAAARAAAAARAQASARRRQAAAAAAAAAAKRQATPTTTAAAPTTAPAPPPAPAPAPPPAPPPPPPPPPPVSAPASTDVGVAASTPEGASVAPPPTHGDVVGIALHYLGVPYVWAGASPSGFDCSGFTMYVYSQVGVSLPHYAAAQFAFGAPVSRDQLQPGDLVFFDGLTHVGIYIGGGQFVHAPHTGDIVKISSLSEDWYAQTYDGARRL